MTLPSQSSDYSGPTETRSSLGRSETALAKAYLHPDMHVAIIAASPTFITAGVAPRVRRVTELDDASADNSLDAIFANLSAEGRDLMRLGPDLPAAIHAMTRRLRPGGRLVIANLDAPAVEGQKTGTPPSWPGLSRPQLQAWFEAAGLVNIIVDEAIPPSPHNGQEENPGFELNVAVGTKRISARAAVQASYDARAQEEGSGCGDGGCCSPGVISLEEVGAVEWDGGYGLNELAGIPPEAAQFSLGCGNPVALAGLRPGETVLDIGSGGGIDVFLAAKQVGPGGFVYGIDMTPTMLARARQTAARFGYTNVDFRQGYAENLPVENDSVDVILSNCVINLTEDKGKVFQQAYRALKPGGRLEVNDMVFGGAVLPETRNTAAGWSECISGALPEQEYLDLVKQAGFCDVQARRSTSQGSSAGAAVYSVQVSARKPVTVGTGAAQAAA